ncbi:hypothetical protein ABZ816_38170 [Actinosynnema sp. NPDC047251]|uniref:hypothetical protein n=1 Tax=Saccharothrix espanaensis TaxID=103731 RepID=UPI000315FABA|nr:hypothetical protein [Saccharothrix espanaensis]
MLGATTQAAAASPARLPAVLALQRSAGNRAVTAAVQRYREAVVQSDPVAAEARSKSVRSKANFAVVYVADAGSADTTRNFARWSSYGEPGGSGHAERLAVAAATTAGYGAAGGTGPAAPDELDRPRILSLYTELAPCGACKDWLHANLHENVTVSWTAHYLQPNSLAGFSARLWDARNASLQWLDKFSGQAATYGLTEVWTAVRDHIVDTRIDGATATGQGTEEAVRKWVEDTRAEWADAVLGLEKRIIRAQRLAGRGAAAIPGTIPGPRTGHPPLAAPAPHPPTPGPYLPTTTPHPPTPGPATSARPGASVTTTTTTTTSAGRTTTPASLGRAATAEKSRKTVTTEVVTRPHGTTTTTTTTTTKEPNGRTTTHVTTVRPTPPAKNIAKRRSTGRSQPPRAPRAPKETCPQCQQKVDYDQRGLARHKIPKGQSRAGQDCKGGKSSRTLDFQ